MWLKKHKSLLMPVSMLIGVIFYRWLADFMIIVPFTVAIMFFLAYCSIDFRRLKLTKTNIIMLVLHIVFIFFFYTTAKLIFSDTVSKGVLMCTICPTAASASAIIMMLGGNKEVGITHIILDNILVSFLAPLILSAVEPQENFSYLLSVFDILKKVFPLLILPIILTAFVKRLKPKWTVKIAEYNWLSLLFWSVSLVIIFSRTTDIIVNAPKNEMNDIIIMALISFVVCILQFALGKLFGKKLHNSVAVTQGLAQKNTSLGIWLAHTYLSNPLSIIFSTAYSLYQNLINSWQVYRHDKKEG
ncbi:MAG: bile acid:sodium symporter [Bacteroidales bacterium]|nr:bile acid:sodium symporter [Bacteroidales bacterium]